MAMVQSEARIIVGLHIGSYQSSFAFAHKSIPDSTRTHGFGWLSAIYYEPGDAATAKVKSWGFEAFRDYERAIDLARQRPSMVDRAFGGQNATKIGTFFVSFEDARDPSTALLQKNFTLTQVISDYLRLMAAEIIRTLQRKYGNHVSMNDVEWCVALAHDWNEHAMELMRTSMERAGFVQSAISRGGSPYPLRFVPELDAASYHCLQESGDSDIKAGDKLLVADLGYESCHISVQEVHSMERSKFEVKQVAESVGNLGGPKQLDKMLMELLMAKMLPVQDNELKAYAFKQFFQTHLMDPGGDLWYNLIRGYNTGYVNYKLPINAQNRWKQLDVEHGNKIRVSYDVIEVSSVEFQTAIKPYLDICVAVIAPQLLSIPNIKAILLVGELCSLTFSTSIYKLFKQLNTSVKVVTSVTDASTGAVAMVLNQVLPFTWKGGGKLVKDGVAFSSHGDGIIGQISSPKVCEVLPACGSTSPSFESSNVLGGGEASEPSLETKPSNCTVESVVFLAHGSTSPSFKSSNALGGGAASKPSLETKPSNCRVESVVLPALGSTSLSFESSNGLGGDATTEPSLETKPNISRVESVVLPARGSTSPSFESSNALGGGAASEPSLVTKPNNSRVESVVKKYSWDQVLQMTEGLTSRELGKGGFGTVYLGKFENGREVAVKVLNQSSQEGKLETFVNEVNLSMQVNHVNLVKLLGYCQDERDVVIYEYAEEGSIRDHLHGKMRRLSNWKERLNVILQAACGIEYLHSLCSPRIIHRDIKSENILLTRDMVAKVADFGISRLMGGDEAEYKWRSHLTTRVMGSLGYLDPEYYQTGRLKHSSDVYSYGIVLLEMITGRKPVPNPDDASCCIGPWVKRNYGRGGSGAMKVVVDSSLSGNYNPKAMKLVIKLALSCIDHDGGSRPKMSEVVCVLQKALRMELEEKKSWISFH